MCAIQKISCSNVSAARLRTLLLLVVMGGVLAASTGCTSTLREIRLHKQRSEALEAFAQHDYALAAARFESLSDRYPDSIRRQEMMREQGISLYLLGSYHSAREVFQKYLKQYPEGPLVSDVQSYLDKIEILTASGPLADAQVLQAAKSDLNTLYQLQKQHPHDPEVCYALGNKLWQLGQKEEALRFYGKAQELNATYQEKALIRERMIVNEDGEVVPISPEMIEQRYLEEHPLVVFDTHHYTSRATADNDGETWSARQRFYQVTGRVRNQSSRLIHDVEVEVQFLNLHNELLDVKVVRLGSLGPGVVKAFRVKSGDFDNIFNISNYRCQVRQSE